MTRHKNHHSHHQRNANNNNDSISGAEEQNNLPDASKMDSKLLEKKLENVRDSAEDIQLLSKWCIRNRTNHHAIIQAWSRAIRKCK